MLDDFTRRRFRIGGAALTLSALLGACSGGGGSVATAPLASDASGPLPQTARTQSVAVLGAPNVAAALPVPTSQEFFAGLRAGANPKSITRGAGGMWFTEFAGDRIAMITAGGAVTEFSTGISPGAGLNSIAAGKNDRLWFTEANLPKIGRITPAGAVTEFATADTPWAITGGPDGNMWFTERTAPFNAIGRITPQGVVTEFTAGLSAGDPAVHDITAGPDGNVWFTEEFANKIGRITPRGVITEFANGISPGANLVDIAGGPDGNVWFTEYGANKIGRITPRGVVTEFSAGISPGAEPASITAAAGALWFTEFGTNKLAKITTAGRVTEYPLSIAGCPTALAKGMSDLWIVDYCGNGIVKVTK